MENKNANNSQNKKLLYEFLDSYPKTTTNNSKENNTFNNKNNSIDILINFMNFMNSKDKKNKKEENEIMSDSLNAENNNNEESSENNKIKDSEDDEKISNGNTKQINIQKGDVARNYYKNISSINSSSINPTEKSFKKNKKESNKNKYFQNYQYQAVIDEANQILQNKYKQKEKTTNNNNIILPDVLYPELNLENMNKSEKKADEETYKEKVFELNKERIKNKNEKEKIKKLKINYANLYDKLQNEISKFNLSNQKKLENFNKYKNDEKDKIEKEKKQLIAEQKEIGELRIKYQMNNKMNNKKDKEDIIHLKKMFQKFQLENKSKESNNKILIDKYKRELDEANNQILLLNSQITKLQNLQNKQESPRFNINKEEKKEETAETYDLIFPDVYHKEKYKLIKTVKTEDGKKINFFDKNKKEIIFLSGIRKEIYFDGYQIIYFTNGDIKQIFPEKRKQVYYFNESKIIQTTIPDKIQVFKFENGQIEKHFINGDKEIVYPNGNIKRINKDGKEENFFNEENEENNEDSDYEEME